MKLVIYHTYTSPETGVIPYIEPVEYESVEKFLADFKEWCSTEHESFCGTQLSVENLTGSDVYSEVKVYTLEDWFEEFKC